jgi:hypothetical protein
MPLPSGRQRERTIHAGHRYRLRDTETHTLDTLATFRVVLDRDLVEGVYGGDRGRFAEDLRSLTAQGLVAHRALAADRQGHHVRVLTLTRDGHHLLQHRRGASSYSSGPQRPVYAGWGKPPDLVHDASLYRMYLTAVAPLARQGATVRRVALDAELKRRLFREANRDVDLPGEARREHLAELARDEGLPIVDGHVQVPDLRIEYETAGGERAHVDLELVTAAYHGGHLSAKQQAGFTLYSAAGHAGRGIASLQSAGGGLAFDPRHLSGLLSL